MHITERSQSIWFQLYDFLEKAKLWRQKIYFGCWGLWGKRGICRWYTEDFYGSETIVCGTTMVDTSHYALVKPIECTTLAANHNIYYGLWVIMACQCRLIKGTVLLKDLYNGRDYACVEAGLYEKSHFTEKELRQRYIFELFQWHQDKKIDYLVSLY